MVLDPTAPPPCGCSPSLVDQLSPASGSAEGARFLLTRNCVHLPCSHPRLASGRQPGPITPMTAVPQPSSSPLMDTPDLSWAHIRAQLWENEGQDGTQGQSLEPGISDGIWAVSFLCLSEAVPLAWGSIARGSPKGWWIEQRRPQRFPTIRSPGFDLDDRTEVPASCTSRN